LTQKYLLVLLILFKVLAFHNADIPQEERYLIEREFRHGSLNILVATQTLAYGLKLPIGKRCLELIPSF